MEGMGMWPPGGPNMVRCWMAAWGIQTRGGENNGECEFTT